jgi:hypothetical protein
MNSLEMDFMIAVAPAIRTYLNKWMVLVDINAKRVLSDRILMKIENNT